VLRLAQGLHSEVRVNQIPLFGPDAPIVRFALSPGAKAPTRGSHGASGFDLYAFMPDMKELRLDGRPELIHTGVHIELPYGLEAQVRPRSSVSHKGIHVAFGTVDSDYRGEILVNVCSFGYSNTIKHGDRIAQLVIAPVWMGELEYARDIAELSPTGRGKGGFGSTGR
jgi:dUTP pyrophosphatase